MSQRLLPISSGSPLRYYKARQPKGYIMQCANKNTILTIDKKAITRNMRDFQQAKDKTAKKLYNKIIKAGQNCWELGVEIYFHDRRFTFFNKTPSGASKKQWEQYWLWKMGYYKENKVGCGKCEICRTDKSKQWAVKSTCEYKTWNQACFLTLTYNEQNHELNNGFINKANMTKFWKDLRYHLYKDTKKSRKIDLKQENENMQELPEEIKLKYEFAKRKPNNKPLRYIQCHEYGTKKGREHHHAVIFNFKPCDLVRHSRDRRGYYLYKSKKINSIWGHGYVIIADVNANVAAYVARYNTKKFSNTSGIVNETIQKLNNAMKYAENDKAKEIIKNEYDVWKRRRESISASSLGYIGSYYWEMNKEKIIKQGGIYVNWKKGVNLEKIPKPMEKQYEQEYPLEYDVYEYEKEKNGKEQWEKILTQTTLSESEYIEMTYRQRTKSLRLLKRDYDEKPTRLTIFENA